MSCKDIRVRTLTCDRCGYSAEINDEKCDIDFERVFEGWGELYTDATHDLLLNVKHTTRHLCPECNRFYLEMMDNFFNY